VLIQPATVLKWHREGYRRYWRRRSSGLGGRPQIPRSHIILIRRISSDHPEWGEDRIALELWLGEVLCIKGIPIPYGASNAAAHIERFMGSLRRECLNHFIFLSEDHLRRTVAAYIAYYNESRPHQGIEGIPDSGPGLPRETPPATRDGPIKVVAGPVLGGLHHDYRIAA
jgi:transposase InsO family protein